MLDPRSGIPISRLEDYPGEYQGDGYTVVDTGPRAYRLSAEVYASYLAGKALAINAGFTGALDESISDRFKGAVSAWSSLSSAVKAEIEGGAEVPISQALRLAMRNGRSDRRCSVVLPPGRYALDEPIEFQGDRQGLHLDGCILRPTGAFPVFRNPGFNNLFLAGGVVDGNSMPDTFDLVDGEKIPRSYLIDHRGAGRMVLSRMQANGMPAGVFLEDVNNFSMYDLNLADIRGLQGAFAYRFTATANARTDLIRMYASGSSWTDAAALAGGRGMDLWGDAQSVELYGVHCVRPGIGLHARRRFGKAPFGFNATSYASADFSAFENVKLECGTKFFFGTGFYGHGAGTRVFEQSWNEVPAVDIGADCQYIQFTGGGISTPRRESFVVAGKEVDIRGLTAAHFNSPSQAGKHDCVRLTGTARNIDIADNTLGARSGIGAQVRYAVMIEPGARQISIVGNREGGYFLDFICDRSGGDFGNVQHTANPGARFSEVDGVRTTRFSGAHADFRVNLDPATGSAVSITTIRKGVGFKRLPGVRAIGDGAPPSVSVALDGIGGLEISLLTGGLGNTWCEIVVEQAAVEPHIEPARTDSDAAQDFGMYATGGAAALFGNSRGIGFAVGADGEAVNYFQSQGRATGSGAELRAMGPDESIHALIIPKGPDGHRGVGNAKTSPVAGAFEGFEYQVINGVVRMTPFYRTP